VELSGPNKIPDCADHVNLFDGDTSTFEGSMYHYHNSDMFGNGESRVFIKTVPLA
jgi:hypothetical protein